MSSRKYLSGYEKKQKKLKIENFVKSKKGAIEKFVLCNKKNQANSSKSNEGINEEVLGDNNDPIVENTQKKIENTLDGNENQENNDDMSRIYDPGRWKNLDSN